MASAALTAWHGVRRQRMDELYAAHAAVGGSSRGRRTATSQLNWALALRLAGEFQGFARDLHDEAIFVLAGTAATPAIESVLTATFAVNRKLDFGNANRSTLKLDFEKLGIPILDLVKSHAAGATWLKSLDELNTARNAIAHSQEAKLLTVLSGAPALRLVLVKQWDGHLKRLATTMDTVVSGELAQLTGTSRPW